MSCLLSSPACWSAPVHGLLPRVPRDDPVDSSAVTQVRRKLGSFLCSLMVGLDLKPGVLAEIIENRTFAARLAGREGGLT